MQLKSKAVGNFNFKQIRPKNCLGSDFDGHKLAVISRHIINEKTQCVDVLFESSDDFYTAGLILNICNRSTKILLPGESSASTPKGRQFRTLPLKFKEFIESKMLLFHLQYSLVASASDPIY